MRPVIAVLFASLLALGATGCPGPGDPPTPVTPSCRPGGCADAGGPVFPGTDGGEGRPTPLCENFEFASSCTTSCVHGLTCFRERSTTATVETPSGEVSLDVIAFPNGMCSRACGDDGDCGFCARCVDHALAGRARLRGLLDGSGVCRSACESGCPPGTACDPETGACLEACTSDEQCRFSSVDTDGDGTDDALAYDEETDYFCSAGVCTTSAGPALGGNCYQDFECEPGYACLVSPSMDRVGRCGRRACSEGGCGSEAVCIPREPDSVAMCARRCAVGADAADERLGYFGRGAGCDEGFACVPLSADPSSRDGACVPGNYNSTPEPNTGASCTDDFECFSPYGRGRCARLRAGASGVCTVVDCVPGDDGLWPGIALAGAPEVCAPADGIECVHLGVMATGPTRCARTCEVPGDCPSGWACVPQGAASMCFPTCTDDAQCRAGTSCQFATGAPCGPDDANCACL